MSLVQLFLWMGGWYTVLFAVAAIGITVFSSLQAGKAQRFEENGREATATVEERSINEWTDNDGDTRESHYLTVTFTTHAGEAREVKEGVNRARYHSVREGDTLSLIYLEGAPGDIVFSLDDVRYVASTTELVALGLGVLALGGLWYSGSRAVAAVRARNYGKREAATVTGIKQSKIRHNKQYRYHLTWREADGRAGQSLGWPREEIEDIPEGSEITVYQGVKRAWWTGDVGERPGAG